MDLIWDLHKVMYIHLFSIKHSLRFVTNYDFVFSNGQFDYLFFVNFFNFGTNVSRRLPFIALSVFFSQIAVATHGKRSKYTIFHNAQTYIVTCVDDLSTQKQRSISQSPRTTPGTTSFADVIFVYH